MTAGTFDRPLLALLIRLLGIAGFATMAALIKLASNRGVHLVEIMFWRQLTSLPLLLGWLIAVGGLSRLKTKRPITHGVRALYGIVGMVLNFGAVILLPLAEATVLNFTTPMWAVILSAMILHEKIGLWRWSAVALGFAGILLIAQPSGDHLPLFGALVGLGAAFMVALIAIQIRDLNRTEEPITIVFWFAAISSIVMFPLMFLYGQNHGTTEWLLLLGIGLSGTWGQLLVTAALRYGAVASVVVMDYSSLVWATLYGWLWWDVLPPAITWAGAPLIVAAGLIIAWREHKRKSAVDAASARDAAQ